MTRIVRIAVFCSLAGLGPAAAFDDKSCDSIHLDAAEEVIFARVAAGTPKLNFIKGSEGGPFCPSDVVACKKRAFVIEGDLVLINKTAADFVCAEFTNKKNNTTVGFLPYRFLLPEVPPKVPLEAWLGKWSGNREQTIEIRNSKTEGKLSVIGEATWGAFDPKRVKNGGVNIGSLDAVVTPKGPLIQFTDGGDADLKVASADYSCRVRIRLLGNSLLVVDNYRCGGMNVTFTGTYSR